MLKRNSYKASAHTASVVTLASFIFSICQSPAAVAFDGAFALPANSNHKMIQLESESGGVFFGGGESESGGVYGSGGESESGGVWDQGASTETGGPRNSGGESESGGPANNGAESESGGPANNGAETESGGPGVEIRNYR
jgi:hypothetical protein